MPKPKFSEDKAALIPLLDFLKKQKEDLLMDSYQILYKFFKRSENEGIQFPKSLADELRLKAKQIPKNWGLPVFDKDLDGIVYVELNPRTSRNLLKSSFSDLQHLLVRENPKNLKVSVATVVAMRLIGFSLGLAFKENGGLSKTTRIVRKYCVLLKHIVQVMKQVRGIEDEETEPEEEDDQEQGACAMCKTSGSLASEPEYYYDDDDYDEKEIWADLEKFCGTFSTI